MCLFNLSSVRTGAPGMISDRKYHLHSYKQCFVGSEFVDWLVEEGDVKDRDEATKFGKKLLKANIIRHGKLCHVTSLSFIAIVTAYLW